MAIYALAFYGGWGFLSVVFAFLEHLELPHIGTATLILGGVLLVGTLVLVYLLGVWVGSRLWLLAPLGVIILPAWYIPLLGQKYLGWPSDPGWAFVFIFAAIYALVSLLPAGLGIQAAFWRADEPADLAYTERRDVPWAVPLTVVGLGVLVPGLVTGVGWAVLIGLFLFFAGALASGALRQVLSWWWW